MVSRGLLLIVVLLFSCALAPRPPPAVIRDGGGINRNPPNPTSADQETPPTRFNGPPRTEAPTAFRSMGATPVGGGQAALTPQPTPQPTKQPTGRPTPQHTDDSPSKPTSARAVFGATQTEAPIDAAANPEPSFPIATMRPTLRPLHYDSPVTSAPIAFTEGSGPDGIDPNTIGQPSSGGGNSLTASPVDDGSSPDPGHGNSGIPNSGLPNSGIPNNGNPGTPATDLGRPVSVIVRLRQGGIVRQPGIKTAPGRVLNAPDLNTGSNDHDADPATDELKPAAQGLSGGAIAGIVVGVLVGVAALGGLAAFSANAFLSRPPSAATAMSDEEVYHQMI